MRLNPESPFPLNPLAGNPLAGRNDVARAALDCFTPLSGTLSAGGGRALIDGAGAVFDEAAQGMEGFARPLWGLAAMAAGGDADPALWARLSEGLAHGLDPAHADYWGEARALDQRIVEFAAIAFALCVSPEPLLLGLDTRDRLRLADRLRKAASVPVYPNNWHFFPVLIDLALRALGEEGSPVDGHLAAIDALYLGAGHYADGSGGPVDHYGGFAFHFYGLLYARIAQHDPERGALFKARAADFAQSFIHWFADDGAALPMGRSLTYRFAACAFFGACAFADLEALPWGAMKGFYLRHLRWWRQWPITRRDGILSVGYGYPSAQMAENYNSSASPYWAFKAFLPLALSGDHPFWSAEESPPTRPDSATLPPQMLVKHEPGHTVALVSGQPVAAVRHGPEKYGKFAYSTRYAFSVESDARRFDQCSFDSMIGLADRDDAWRVRDACDATRIDDDILVSRWSPWSDVTVETWLYWQWPWHVRVHRVRSGRVLKSIEGGFCLSRDEGEGPSGDSAGGWAHCATSSDFSGIVDLSPAPRAGRIASAEPNTHLLHPRTVLPQLIGTLDVGETLLGCAVLASPNRALCVSAWALPPSIRPLPPA